MKKIFTLLLGGAAFFSAKSQSLWHTSSAPTELARPSAKIHSFFTLDKAALKLKLSTVQAASKNAAGVLIDLPTIDGKKQQFLVYSRPVAEKSLAEKYDLGSFVGVGVTDPSSYVRFSFSNGVFNAMVIDKDGNYTFIDPQDKAKTVYSIAEKSNKTANGRAFVCSTSENVLSKDQIDKLYSANTAGNPFSKNAAVAARSSDQKYRTLRLALSVTGEYTQYFGGTVAGALTAMNATMTRVNGVMERDLGLHLNMIDKPEIIYTDPKTDPYSDAAAGADGAWNLQLQKTLTSVVGEANYDIGHLFGASGGGGNAGCIGCVCTSPPLDTGGIPTDTGKGSGFTSPADGVPTGDNFDIDYVAHEMGHQVGGNHTFSYALESGTGANQEPGSGSTIMGYAGITGANNDVQAHSDAYYHYYSIQQIQAVLAKNNCDVETSVNNTPPTIAALPAYTIPKSTAFVLTANASDADGDGLNYTWEQADNAAVTINKNNLGTTATGADFRSITGTSNPTRYFPAFSTVLNGKVSDPSTWEATSSVARATNFTVTVRDNNPAGSQNTSANEVITVGNDGPFTFTMPGTKVYTNAAQSLIWNVANTAAAPYNSPNVKLDYTTDNGTTWTTIASSTANDGTEAVNISPNEVGKTIKFRATSIGNVFYTISKGYTVLAAPQACDGTAPMNVTVQNITGNSATVSWDLINGATYSINYRIVGAAAWTAVTSATNSVNLTGLSEESQYEVQVAAICSGTTGAYSSSVNFTTPSTVTYCAVTAPSSGDEYISNVTVAGQSMDSGASGYADYTNTASKLITLQQGSTGNNISVAKSWTSSTTYKDGISVWIDFNRNGTFESSEKVLSSPASTTTPVTGTFSVPSTVDPSKTVRMRVVLRYNATPSNACTAFSYGEVEDYRVKFTSAVLATLETNAEKITFFPNPVVDVLNISKVSDKASYTIFNMAGQLVASGHVTDHKVAVASLPKGVYVITVDNNGEKATSKFIKE